jgi:DNA repair exonuclease SbcCD ATPase subunit
MRPVRLRARGFRTFHDLDLEFGTGLVGILGDLRDAPEGADSNGAGKSSILEAIDIALFGRRSLSGYLTRGGDVDELMVELSFEHGDHLYRVRRTYAPKGRGITKVDLERMTSFTYEPLTCATAKETDEFLCDLIGLSRDTFRDSCYLRQGDGGYADPDRDPKQRKQLLVEAVLGRDPIWPKLEAAARERRKDAEREVAQLAGEAGSLREVAEGINSCLVLATSAAVVVEAAADAVTAAEKRHGEIVAQWATHEAAGARRQAAAAELAAAEHTLDALLARGQQADDAATEMADLNDKLVVLAPAAEVSELEQRETELRRVIDGHVQAVNEYDRAFAAARDATFKRNDLLGRASEANERAVKLRHEAAATLVHVGDKACEKCGQPLGAEAAAHTAAQLRAEADQLDTLARELDEDARSIAIPTIPSVPEPPADRGELDDVHRRLTIARTQQLERARYEERFRALEKIADAAPSDEQLAAARADVAERAVMDGFAATDAPAVTVDEVSEIVAEKRRARDAAVAEKARADEQLSRCRAAADRLVVIENLTASRHTEIDRDALLERAYGRDGIPALIIENTAIPYIETEASRILRELGTGFDVQLRTQRETQAGSLRETLDVVVIDPDGNEADFADGCSGGEQTRIGLALRIALARLLASRRGAESRLLALDEPSYLDAAGMAALLDVLRGLDGEFDLILLVSHVAELRDSLDDVIVVVKENGVSSVAGASVEAVLA